MDEIPKDWHVEDTSPSGINRLLPNDYTVSLPHTRTQASFSAVFWLMAGGAGVFAGVVALLVHYL